MMCQIHSKFAVESVHHVPFTQIVKRYLLFNDILEYFFKYKYLSIFQYSVHATHTGFPAK